MPTRFTHSYHARWGDMDFNGHLRNTAYLDLAADSRMLYFRASGFPIRAFEDLKIGPVVLRDEIDYYREVRLLDPVTVGLSLAGTTANGARFRLRNEFFSAAGELVARVTSTGGWLDLATRKLTAPPPALAACVQALERTADYAELPARG